jgi:hypothetical protein
MPKGRGANESRRNERQKKSIRQANTYDRDEKLEAFTHNAKMVSATQGTGVKGPAVCRSSLHPHKIKIQVTQ